MELSSWPALGEVVSAHPPPPPRGVKHGHRGKWDQLIGKRNLRELSMEILGALLGLLSLVHCYGPHHPRGPHYHYKPDASKGGNMKLTQNMELLNDETHIKEDLAGWVEEPDTSKMTPQELAFHYFKVHDFDNNTKLDGLEILQAIRHTVHGHGKTPSAENAPFSPEDFLYYTELIDKVMAEDDLDGDGYLSYIEYVLGREKSDK